MYSHKEMVYFGNRKSLLQPVKQQHQLTNYKIFEAVHIYIESTGRL